MFGFFRLLAPPRVRPLAPDDERERRWRDEDDERERRLARIRTELARLPDFADALAEPARRIEERSR